MNLIALFLSIFLFGSLTEAFCSTLTLKDFISSYLSKSTNLNNSSLNIQKDKNNRDKYGANYQGNFYLKPYIQNDSYEFPNFLEYTDMI